MLNCAIQINDELIAIEGDVNIERYSPFIDNTGVLIPSDAEYVNPRGNYTLPFKTKDKKLGEVSGYLNYLQSDSYVSTFPGARLLCNGQLIDTGTLGIQRITKDVVTGDLIYECILFNDGASWVTAVTGNTLQDLTMDGGRPNIKNTTTVTYGDNTWQPFNCVNDLLQFMRDPLGPFGVSGNSSFEMHPMDGSPWANFYAPTDLEIKNYFSLFFDNPDLFPWDMFQATTAFANNILENGDPYICFPTYYADFEANLTDACCKHFNHFGASVLNYSEPAVIPYPRDATIVLKYVGYGVIKLYNGSEGQTYANYTPFRNQIVPMYYYHQVLRHCFLDFGYQLQGDFINDPDFQKLVLTNTYSILKEEMLTITNIFNSGQNANVLYIQNPTSIMPRNHLPAMNVIDFVRDFMTKFNASITFNGIVATIKKNSLQLASGELDKFNPQVTIEFPANATPGINVSYQFPSGDKSYTPQTDFASNSPLMYADSQGENEEYEMQPDITYYFKITNNVPIYPYVSDNGSESDVTVVINYLQNLFTQGQSAYRAYTFMLIKAAGVLAKIYNTRRPLQTGLTYADWSQTPAICDSNLMGLQNVTAKKNLNIHNLVAFISSTINQSTSAQIQSFQSSLVPVEMLDYMEYVIPQTNQINVSGESLEFGWTGAMPIPNILLDWSSIDPSSGEGDPDMLVIAGSGGGTSDVSALNNTMTRWPGAIPWFSHNPTYWSISVWTAEFSSHQVVTEEGIGSVEVDEYAITSQGNGGVWGYESAYPNSFPYTPQNVGDVEQKIAIYAGLQPMPGTDDITFPLMTFNNYVSTNGNNINPLIPQPGEAMQLSLTPTEPIKINPWNLSLCGAEGLMFTFWNVMLNVFIKNKKVTFTMNNLTWMDIRNFDFTTSRIIRGRKYYVASIKLTLPDFFKTRSAVFECYEL